MLREVIELVSENKLMLFVCKDNDVAINLYKKAGFKITGKFGELAWAMTYGGNEAGKSTILTAESCA